MKKVGFWVHNWIATPVSVWAMRFHDWSLDAFGLGKDHTAEDLYRWRVAPK